MTKQDLIKQIEMVLKLYDSSSTKVERIYKILEKEQGRGKIVIKKKRLTAKDFEE